MRITLTRSLALSLALAYGVASAAEETCGPADDPETICGGTKTVAGGKNPLDAPHVDSGITYEVRGFASGKRSHLSFEPTLSGEFSIYIGGPLVPVEVGDERPSCTGDVPEGCMHTIVTYVLDAGVRYDIELGPIAAGDHIRLRIESFEEPLRVASR